jgi:flagellar hook-length control protein FliK
MSIELSSAPASPKVVAGADKTAAKSKVKSGDETGTPAEGGFAAILTSLDPQAEQSASVDAPLATPDAVLPVVPADPALLLTQAGELGGDKSVDLNNAMPTSVPGELAMRLAQAGGGDKLVSSVPGGVQSARNVVGVDTSALAAEKLLPLGAEKADDLRQNVQSLLDQMAQGLQGMTHKARGLDVKSGAAASLAESRALQQAPLTELVSHEPAMSSALLTSGMGDGFLRPVERSSLKTSIQSGISGMDGSWGQSSFQSANNTDAPSVLIDPSTQSFETTVADTVSFWVKQGVQNAELKLDGLDGESIAVSISLKGDEAHIGFRTDKPETRQMLEGAVAHLKDLLTSEGLVLSGVSVGTSGQDGTGAQEQGSRQGARQTAIVSTENVPAESLQRVSKPTGRTLDLYV